MGGDIVLCSIRGNTLDFASEEKAPVKTGFLSQKEKLPIPGCGIGLAGIEHHGMPSAPGQERGGLWQSLGTCGHLSHASVL